MSTEMTSIELAQLERAEARIEKGMKTFVDDGEALAEIRDNKLYVEDHKTFEAYCDKRWSMSKPYAYQVIAASEATTRVSAMAAIAPTTERVARPLTKLKPDEQVEAWQEVLDTAPDGKVTPALVEQVVAKRVPSTSKPKTKTKPRAEAKTDEPVRVESRQPGEDERPTKNGAEVWPFKERKRAAKLLGQLIRSIPYGSPAHKVALPHLDALTILVERGG